MKSRYHDDAMAELYRDDPAPVSYTHLDVYKRQHQPLASTNHTPSRLTSRYRISLNSETPPLRVSGAACWKLASCGALVYHQ